MKQTNNHPDSKSRRKAVLDIDLVRWIRRSSLSRKRIAEMLGVGEYTVRDVRQYRTWAWVD